MRIEIAMAIKPDHADVQDLRGTGNGPESDTVVASQNDRKRPVRNRLLHDRGELATNLDDGIEMFETWISRIPNVQQINERNLDVANIMDVQTELYDLVPKSRIPDRAGTHINPASARSVIHGNADDSNFFGLHGCEVEIRSQGSAFQE